MSDALKIVIIIVAAYLISSFNPAIAIGFITKKMDIRKHGSGNAGTTNTLRTMGKTAAVIVALIDALKAALSLIIGDALLGGTGMLIAAGAVLLGHAFPVYYSFKGGKGMICSLVIFSFLDWRAMLIGLTVFAAVAIPTRMVALGSLAAVVSLLVSIPLFNPGNTGMIIFTYLAAVFIFFLHRSNIKRIIKGEEKQIVVAEDQLAKGKTEDGK